MTDDFAAWAREAEVIPEATKKTETATFPCVSCGGTGKNHRGNKCFACKGKGHFKTDPRKLKAMREKRKAKRQHDGAENIKFNQSHPWFLKLCQMSDWNEFANSLLEQNANGKRWSENQIAAVERMMAKIAAREEARAEAARKAQVEVNLSPIKAMFESARSGGFKAPKYRAEGLILNFAPEYGKNPGAIYVKDEGGNYLGKVVNGSFAPMRTPEAEAAKEALLRIAENPKDAAIRYGRKTGRCSCCGRELTNSESIALGIGPICASKWGLG